MHLPWQPVAELWGLPWSSLGYLFPSVLHREGIVPVSLLSASNRFKLVLVTQHKALCCSTASETHRLKQCAHLPDITAAFLTKLHNTGIYIWWNKNTQNILKIDGDIVKGDSPILSLALPTHLATQCLGERSFLDTNNNNNYNKGRPTVIKVMMINIILLHVVRFDKKLKSLQKGDRW